MREGVRERVNEGVRRARGVREGESEGERE